MTFAEWSRILIRHLTMWHNVDNKRVSLMELLFVLHMRPQPPSVHGCKKQLNEAARRSQECRSELISCSQSQLFFRANCLYRYHCDLPSLAVSDIDLTQFSRWWCNSRRWCVEMKPASTWRMVKLSRSLQARHSSLVKKVLSRCEWRQVTVTYIWLISYS